MFCVSCGVTLREENQQGIGCTGCRKNLESGRMQLITVKYCYRCGTLFVPFDNAISHLHCLVNMSREEKDGKSERA